MIHFFINDNSDGRFHDINLEAWKEDKNVLYRSDNVYASSFTRVEDIRFHYSRAENYQVRSFKIEFGKNSCTGSNARYVEELIKIKTGSEYSSLEIATREEYEAVRDKVMMFYLEEMKMNFNDL